MRHWLAPDVHAADVDGDLVFLDVATDAYFCLVGGGAALKLLDDGGVIIAPDVAHDLLAAGLLAHRQAEAPRRRASPIAQGLVPNRSPPGLLRWTGAISANLRSARAVRTLSLAELIALTGSLQDQAFDAPSVRLIQEATHFDRMAPWLPREGVCLMRSLQLRLYLARRGLPTAWVFGVRTWPFEAHCWLQAGDVVLDDSAEHASGFTPILVV